MVLHNQYPWNRAQVQLTEVGRLRDDDNVVLFVPRNPDVFRFIKRVKSGAAPRRGQPEPPRSSATGRPVPGGSRPDSVQLWPESKRWRSSRVNMSVTNDDLIRNTAYNWSPMTAEEISAKTGIDQRVYTERSLDDIRPAGGREALRHSGRKPARNRCRGVLLLH